MKLSAGWVGTIIVVLIGVCVAAVAFFGPHDGSSLIK
jgi:hypothetical protein